MKYIKLFLIFALTLTLFSCEKSYDTYDDLYELLVSKQWHLSYISEDRGKGPLVFNDNFNTTMVYFYSDKTVSIKLNSNTYIGTWEVDPIKSSFTLDVNVPDLEYISRGLVVLSIDIIQRK